MTKLKTTSIFSALIIFISLPLFFGIGQEIIGFPGSHDDLYFILRAVSLKMHGSYLAPIKELLYPLFIRVSWVYGLGLRNFEIICYGISLVYLWTQITALTGRRLIGWLSLLPLTLFSYQHTVFNHATYDALQLILLPISFATAINLYVKKASWPSLLQAGILAGLFVLTRPEGILFLLPPCVALAAPLLKTRSIKHFSQTLLPLLPRGVLLLTMALLSQQIACAVNWNTFGFWAPTLIKADGYQRYLTNLMAIQPEDALKRHYITVPKTSLEQAYQVSPTFLKAKPLLDQQLNGHGWSRFAPRRYRATDGSISGGHFQWALLDTGPYIAGSNIKEILNYFSTVANELDAGFASGTLKKRNVLTTALGPEFSFFERGFWKSLIKISKLTFGFGSPDLPSVAKSGRNPLVDSIYDTVALRRTALLKSRQWELSGWVIHPEKGVPDTISLDRRALKKGIKLKIKKRPGVIKSLPHIKLNSSGSAACGIQINSPRSAAGNLKLTFGDQTVLVPLKRLRKLQSGQAYKRPSVYLQVDITLNPPSHKILPITTTITKVVFYSVRGIFCLAVFLTVVLLVYRKSPRIKSLSIAPIVLVTALAASETVEQAPGGIDRERRRLLRVEGAHRHDGPARSFHLGDFGRQFHEVGAFPDPVDVFACVAHQVPA